MTAPVEVHRASTAGDRVPGTRRGRRTKLLSVPVSADGTVDLPDGAFVVAVDFQDAGGLGRGPRPATAWAQVVTEDADPTAGESGFPAP